MARFLQQIGEGGTMSEGSLLEGASIVVGGLIVGLLGYRLFHVAIGLYGFVLGASVGLLIVGPLGTLFVGILVAIVAGVLGAVLVSLVERAAFALAGATIGWLAGLALGAGLGLGPLAWLPAAGFALVGVVAGLAGERLGVSAGTAVAGAWLVVCGGAALSTGARADPHVLPELGGRGVAELLVAVLAVAFALVQLGLDRPREIGTGTSRGHQEAPLDHG